MTLWLPFLIAAVLIIGIYIVLLIFTAGRDRWPK